MLTSNKVYFTKKELYTLLIVAIFLGIISGFNDGRATSSIDEFWITNLIVCFLGYLLALIVRIFFQKLTAKRRGYKGEFKVNPYGIFAGIFTTLLFDGVIYFFVHGAFRVKDIPEQRLGKFRHVNLRKDMGLIAISGFLGNLLLIILFKILEGILPNSVFIGKIITANVLLMLFSFAPIPNESDAFYLFQFSRPIYVGLLALGLIIGLSILVSNLFTSLLVGIVGGIIAAFVFYTQVDEK
jgi:hypothetical protein